LHRVTWGFANTAVILRRRSVCSSVPEATSRARSPTPSSEHDYLPVRPAKVFDLTLPLDQVTEGYRAMDERQAIITLLRP
jgi:hypothetical protein